MKHRILIVGAGAQVNAIEKAIVNSKHFNDINIYICPGNAGVHSRTQTAPEISISGNEASLKQIGDYAFNNKINIVIVCTEELLYADIRRHFLSMKHLSEINIIGPSEKAATMLTGSKSSAKKFMKDFGIPTPNYGVFDTYESASNALPASNYPIVIKADRFTAGKGIETPHSKPDALQILDDFINNGKYEGAGKKLIIEQFLRGNELSVAIAIDTKYNYRLLPTAEEYKKLEDGNRGPNTKGMGASSPSLYGDAAFMEKVKQKIIKPTIHGLKERDAVYKGFLSLQVIRVGDDPFLVGYSCRLGDSQAVVILPRLESDFVDLLYAMIANRLDGQRVSEKDTFTACVALVIKGASHNSEEDGLIGFPKRLQHGKIIFAGAKIDSNKEIVTNGSSTVAQIFAEAEKLDDALNLIYHGIIPHVWFKNIWFRKDIGNYNPILEPFSS